MQKDEMVQAAVDPAADVGAVTLSLVERLTSARKGARTEEDARAIADAQDVIERLTSQGGAPEGWTREAILDLAIRLEERGAMHRPTVQGGGLGLYGAGDGQLDIDAAMAIRAMLSQAPRPPEGGTGPHSRTEQVLEDARTAIKIHDGVIALKAERDNWRLQYFEARDALYQFNYPPCPKMLRDIADEIDCGDRCEYQHTEWDTGAHVCSRSDKDDGCAGEKAFFLREFAKALDIKANLPTPPVQDDRTDSGEAQSISLNQTSIPEGYVLVPREPDADMAEVARDWAQRDWNAFGDPKGYLKFYQGIYRAMINAAPKPEGE